MEHNYVDVPAEENLDVPIYDRNYFDECCILVTSALTTFIGGLLLYNSSSNNDAPYCRKEIKTLNYYSQYLLIDGLAQIIICIYLIFAISCFKKINVKNEVNRQLFFQIIDTGVLLFVLLIIELVLKQKKNCLSFGASLYLAFYMFWTYILFFFLIIAKFDS